jgi:hypothetical protein
MRAQTVPRYKSLYKTILARMKEATLTLKQMRYECRKISPKEFYDYMTGETPTGDTITVFDVLRNKYLMIHEIVEISELKKLGIPINKDTVMRFHTQVYEAHFTAMEWELTYASSKKNYTWVKTRVALGKSWLEDDLMPKHLVPTCEAFMKKFSEIPRK